MNRISPTVKQLLIINVIFYFGSSVSLNTEFIYSLFSLHFPENPDFKFWQLITHMFMHGGILHLAFNMFALWMFGSAIESIFGSRRFIFFLYYMWFRCCPRSDWFSVLYLPSINKFKTD